jgi:hypothetical protein
MNKKYKPRSQHCTTDAAQLHFFYYTLVLFSLVYWETQIDSSDAFRVHQRNSTSLTINYNGQQNNFE